MLRPTSPRLLDPGAVPYLLWDTRQTVAEARRILAGPASPERDEILVRLLREANSRDVWLFTRWDQLDEAWSRIAHRLGRARPVWEWLKHRHEYPVRAAS